MSPKVVLLCGDVVLAVILIAWGAGMIRAGYRGAVGAFAAALVLVPGALIAGIAVGAIPMGGAPFFVAAIFVCCLIGTGWAWRKQLLNGLMALLGAFVMALCATCALEFTHEWLASAAADDVGVMDAASVVARSPRGFEGARGPWVNGAARVDGVLAVVLERDVARGGLVRVVGVHQGRLPTKQPGPTRRGAERPVDERPASLARSRAERTFGVIRLRRDFNVHSRERKVIEATAAHEGFALDDDLLVYRPQKAEHAILSARDVYRWCLGLTLAILGVVAGLSLTPRRFGGARL